MTALDSGVLAAQYHAARHDSVLIERADLALLRLEGKDATDLLHRLSTNALKDLKEGEGAPTVFTTNKGRILDLATAHRIAAGIHLIVSASRAATLREWVERYTFREEVRVEDRSDAEAIVGLYGPRSGSLVAGLWPAAAALPPFGVLPVTVEGCAAVLARAFPLAGDGFLLMTPRTLLSAARRFLLARGAATLTAAGEECLELLRLEAGMPAADRELTDDHNPWEARLGDAISLSKGCYVGQEVIARLNTYKKVARLLVRLSARAATPITPGATIRIGGAASGEVTSSAVVPDGSGRVVALGYVRDEDAQAGAADIVSGESVLPATLEGVAR